MSLGSQRRVLDFCSCNCDVPQLARWLVLPWPAKRPAHCCLVLFSCHGSLAARLFSVVLQTCLQEIAAAGPAHKPLGLLTAPLRDHRAHVCNADDFLRMRGVQGEGSCFRDMPGVVTHKDGTCCTCLQVCWRPACYEVMRTFIL